MSKTIAVLMLAAMCCAAFGVAGASPPDRDAEAGEEELERSYEDIDRMLRDDDPRVPIDYGYGPGVLLPPASGQPAGRAGSSASSGQ
jgi:hypothetical protein